MCLGCERLQQRAISVMNQVLEELKVKKHPDKPTPGVWKKGLNRFSPDELTISQQMLSRMATNLTGLQEQQACPRKRGPAINACKHIGADL